MSDELRDRIADELAGHQIGTGYYAASVGMDEAREMAQAVIDELGLTTVEEREAQEPMPVRRFGRTEWGNRPVTLHRVVGRWEEL